MNAKEATEQTRVAEPLYLEFLMKFCEAADELFEARQLLLKLSRGAEISNDELEISSERIRQLFEKWGW